MSSSPSSTSSDTSFTSVEGEDVFEYIPSSQQPRGQRLSGETTRRVSILSAVDVKEMARRSSDVNDFIDDRREDDMTSDDGSNSSRANGTSDDEGEEEHETSCRRDSSASNSVADTSCASFIDDLTTVRRAHSAETSRLLRQGGLNKTTPPESSRSSLASSVSTDSAPKRRKSGHEESRPSSSGRRPSIFDRLIKSAPVNPLRPVQRSPGDACTTKKEANLNEISVIERKRRYLDEHEDLHIDAVAERAELSYYQPMPQESDNLEELLSETRRQEEENNPGLANVTKSPMVAQSSSEKKNLFDSFEGIETAAGADGQERKTAEDDVVEISSDSPVPPTAAGGRRLKKGFRRSSSTGSLLVDEIRRSLGRRPDSIGRGGVASLFSRKSEGPDSLQRRSSGCSAPLDEKDGKREEEDIIEGDVDEFGFTVDKKYARLAGGWKVDRRKYDSLYDYQKEGVKWMYGLFKEGKGGILADIMGMGKTVQICILLRGLLKGGLACRVLILCEKSLRDTWEKETAKWCGNWHITSLCAYNSAPQREKKLRHSWLARNCIVIANQTFIRDDNLRLYSACHEGDGRWEEADRVPWDIIVYDEAQRMRNPSTALFRHATLMRAKSKFLLTGTPIQNTPSDLWALMEIAVPGLLGEFATFKNTFAEVIKRGNRREATETQERNKDRAVEELNALIYDYVLRREKYVDEITEGDVSKLEVIVWIGLSEEQLGIYREYITTRQVRRACSKGKDQQKGMHALRCISKLRSLCNHPLFLLPSEEQGWRAAFGVTCDASAQDIPEQDDLQLALDNSGSSEEPDWIDNEDDGAMDNYNRMIRALPQDDGRKIEALSSKLQVLHCLLRRLRDGGHRVLLFCPWTSMLDLVQYTILRTDGMTCLRIDGNTSSNDRQRKIRKFQNSKKYFAFVLSTRCGHVGLTLTAADRVVLISPSWNPSDDDQAVARAYRIGQSKDVIAYRLVCSGTIEERIFQREVTKIGDSKVILEDKDQAKYFSEIDLRRLFEYTDPTDLTSKDTLRDTTDSDARKMMLEKLEEDLGGVASFMEQCHGMTIDFSDYGQLYKK